MSRLIENCLVCGEMDYPPGCRCVRDLDEAIRQVRALMPTPSSSGESVEQNTAIHRLIVVSKRLVSGPRVPWRTHE